MKNNESKTNWKNNKQYTIWKPKNILHQTFITYDMSDLYLEFNFSTIGFEIWVTDKNDPVDRVKTQ